jgi:phosphoesterase RecJ-like protein
MSIFTEQKIALLKTYLEGNPKCVIIAHKSPDGDSIGSSLGLYHYLVEKGVHVDVCHPDPAPHFLEWMEGTSAILNGEDNFDAVSERLLAADVIFCLDFNDTSRVGKLTELLQESTAKKVMIDHHLNPKDEFDLQFSDTSSCSTAQLIVELISAMGDESILNAKMGTPLYCGIMTDTGSFRFSSVTAETHEIVAKLMKAGVESYQVHEAVFDTNTLDRLKIRGYTINEKLELLQEGKTALISLSKDELEKFNVRKGDTEGLVNVGLSIVGVTRSIFLKESDGIIKISFRSKGKDNPINVIAQEYFSGGGHANAAGGKWDGSLEEAIEKIKEVL